MNTANATGSGKQSPNTMYTLTLDWPDYPDGEKKPIRCDADECKQLLARLPMRFSDHALYGAPLMIEIRESEVK